jgi:pantoate--beta-alanine ligase
MFGKGERLAAPIMAAMDEVIREAPLAKVDYVAIVNPETLREIRRVESEAMVLLGVRLGKTRLIDNCHLSARN